MRIMKLIGSVLDIMINSVMRKLFSNTTLATQFFLLVALIGTVLGFYNLETDWSTIGLIILGYWLYGCLGIVVTFHRQLTHQSYTTHKLISNIGSFLGCMANTGSTFVWTAIHLKHHLKSDKEGDPHSPWIVGWRVFLLDYPIDGKIKFRLKHIIKDPYHQFLHRNYNLLLILYSLCLYLIGGWYLMIFLHWAPVVLVAIMSNIVNYAGHKESWLGSYRTYQLSDHSCNNWVWALPSWGEGWHNNHHRFPKNYTTMQKWWELDVSGLIIGVIKKNG